MMRLLKFEGEKLLRNPLVLLGMILLLAANFYLFGRVFWADGGLAGIARDREASAAYTGRYFDEETLAEIQAGIADGSLEGTGVKWIYDNIFRSMEEARERAGSGQIGYDPVSGTVYGPSGSPYEGLGLETVPYSWQTGWNVWVYLAEGMAGLVLMFGIVCTAMLFSREYAVGTAPVILTAKYGKTRGIAAKILVGFGWNVLLMLVLLGGNFLLVGWTYGFSGLEGDLRALFMTNNNYAAMMESQGCTVTTGEFIRGYFLFALSAALLASAISMVCSALLKNSAGAVVTALVVCYLHGMIGQFMPEGSLLVRGMEHLPGRVIQLYTMGMRWLARPELPGEILSAALPGALLLILPIVLTARQDRVK